MPLQSKYIKMQSHPYYIEVVQFSFIFMYKKRVEEVKKYVLTIEIGMLISLK